MEALEARLEQMAQVIKEQAALILSLKEKLGDEEEGVSSAACRGLCIQQVKSQFTNPADKRAMGYLTDLGIDIKELTVKMGCILAATPGHATREYTLPTLEDQHRLVQGVLDVVTWLNTTRNKFRAEKEAYQLASRSKFGWENVKEYEDSEFFFSLGCRVTSRGQGAQ